MTTEDLVRLAAKTGAEAYRRERDAEIQEMRDKRLRNTKLLLQNYHAIRASVDHSVSYAEDSDTALDVLAELMVGKGTFFADSIRRNVAKSAILLDHIDSMLEVYKERCSKSTLTARRFQIIQMQHLQIQN